MAAITICSDFTWWFFPCCLYFFFVFNFCQFDYYMSQYVSPWVYHVWDSLNLSEYFLPHVREIFNYNLFKILSELFFFSSSSEIPIIWMSVHLLLSQQSLRLSSIVFILFSLFFFSVYFHHSIFQLTYLFCLSYYAIVFFQSIFNFSNCVVHHCLFILYCCCFF